MADQQFCLRWNNHQSTLISVFDSLLERGAMVDCTLAAEGQCLQAHKVVLSACSPYLETLLSQHYDKHPILLLKDVKFYELQAMMDYMYRGEVNVAQDKLGMFLKAAESLQIKGLSDSGGNEPPDTGGGTSSKRTSKGAPVTNLPRGSGLTVERRRPQQPQAAQVVDIPSDSGSRDGSESPLRRKRPRRTSGGGDSAIEGETSNTGDVSRTQSSSAPLSSDQVPMNGSADSNALGILSSLMDGTVETDNNVQEPGPSLGSSSQTQPSLRIREKMEPSTTEMIQPKAEYLESEENVEDLTLDDDNVDTGMDAGPSQRQGSAYQWHMGDQGADEVFMAAQEAVGANRDAQGCITPQKHLWKFLLELLDNPEFSPRYIKWINRESNVFKLVDPRMVATLWGTHKNKPDMTYESMGRGLRYYYKRGILARAKCKGQSHTYKFEHIPVAEDGYIKNAVELHHLVRDFPLTDRRLNNSVAVPEVVHINEGDNSIDIQDNFKEEAL